MLSPLTGRTLFRAVEIDKMQKGRPLTKPFFLAIAAGIAAKNSFLGVVSCFSRTHCPPRMSMAGE